MTDPMIPELRKMHAHEQQNYTYFMLAAAVSGIGIAVHRTTDMTLSLGMWPLGLALLSWGLSFFFGVKNREWFQMTLMAEYDLSLLKSGIHPQQPSKPDETHAAITGTLSGLQDNARRAGRYGREQFNLLVLGGLLFLIWHILQMVQ